MKNIIVSAGIFLLVFLTSCKQNPDSYKIEGEIRGLEDGTKVELIPGATKSREKPVAESVVKDGKFKLMGTLDEPRLFYLLNNNINDKIPIMLENGHIKLKANVDSLDWYGTKLVRYQNVKIKGSSVHDLYVKKMSFMDSFQTQFRASEKMYTETLTALVQAQKLEQSDRVDSILNTQSYQKFINEYRAISEKQELRSGQVAVENRESFWGPLVMLESRRITDEDKDLYNSFSQEAKDSYYGKLLGKLLFPEQLAGKSMPLFELPDKDGMLFSSSTLIEEKKYVLIDFWASWCKPCRRSIPELKKIYSEFSSKGLQIISISIDRNKENWLKALSEENMDWPNLLGNDTISKQYQVRFIPKLFLVDEKGIIIETIEDDLKGEDLYNKLLGLLSKE
jgi:thiol-disulfide isomerase/thioredoxin